MRHTAQEKTQILQELDQGKSISELSSKYRVSRVSLSAWRNRMAETGSINDQYKRGDEHYRFISRENTKAVLDEIVDQPHFSALLLYEDLKLKGYQIGYHQIQLLLERYNLSTIADRQYYVQRFGRIEEKQQAQAIDTTSLPALDQLSPTVLPGPPPVAPVISAPAPQASSFQRFFSPFSKSLGITLLVVIVVSGFFFSLFQTGTALASARSPQEFLGFIFASLALTLGFLFFLYSFKYYFNILRVLIFSRNQAQDRTGPADATGSGLIPDLSGVTLVRHPFVSIHLPIYNEKRVVNRLLESVTSLDYPRIDPEGNPIPGSRNYEIVVCDDSTDETKDILLDWKNHPLVKISHRENRSGFKGGALKQALNLMDSRTEFVLVFDADFLPYPDTITQFLKYFQTVSPGGTLGDLGDLSDLRNIAAVQGYQWHVLNKSENWVTRGVRTEYSGSYVIERSASEIYRGLKQIAGSVFMVRADILKLPQYQWGNSITEDFELTLKLYRDGYKVAYTPYVQAPSECVSTLKRLVRQRMRWAEGHSHNIKKMFKEVLFGYYQKTASFEAAICDSGMAGITDSSSKFNLPFREDFVKGSGPEGDRTPGIRLEESIPNQSGPTPRISIPNKWIPSRLTPSEKLEFLYLSPYYLQSFFFLLGTFSWFISETVFRVRLPFWTAIWGWSLVLTNLLSLPLMNTVGLFLEEAEGKDYSGIPSFLLQSYILAPFQAYAAVKGFLEKEEGPWFRTPKTGRITDIYRRGKFYRWLAEFFPGRVSGVENKISAVYTNRIALAVTQQRLINQKIRKATKRLPVFGRALLSLLLICSMLLSYFSFRVPLAEASPGTQIKTVEFMITQYNSATDIVRGDGVAGTDYSDDIGQYSSIAFGSDGFARIATYDADGGDLRYIACSNADCTTQSVNLDVDTSNNVGQWTSMFLTSDLPTISYYDVTATALKLARCTGDGADAGSTACDATGEWTLTTVDNATAAITGQYTSIAKGADGFPRISYYDGSGGNLLLVQCNDVDCSGTGETITTVESTNNVGQYTSLVLDGSGNPMISYYDVTGADLRYVLCTNNSCSTVDADTPITLYSLNDSGQYNSIAKGSDGFPRISFYGNNADLLYVICGSADCLTVTATVTVDATGTTGLYSSHLLNSSDLGRIVYNDSSNGTLKYAQCTGDGADAGTTVCDDATNEWTLSTLDGGTGANQAGKVGAWAKAAWKSSDDTLKIVHQDTENSYILFTECTNTACTTRNMSVPDVGAAATANDASVTINLPESGITVRKAVVEWRTIHAGIPNNRTSMAAEMRFYRSGQTQTTYKMGRRTTASTATAESEVFLATAESVPMVFRMEVGSQINSGSNTYSFNATMWGPSPRNTDSAKIYITYEYDDSSATQLKTVHYFAGQDTGSDQTSVNTTVNPAITEGSASIAQHWFEMTGVYDDAATSNDINVIAGFATGACGTPATTTKGVIDGTQGTTFDYLVMFDASSTTPTLDGNNCITINVSGTTAQAGLKAAEWVITYSYAYYSTTGDDTTHVKTVRYFVGQASGDLATTQATIATIVFNLPETTITFKSAFVRYWFTHDAASSITPEICEGATCTTGSSHTVPLETTGPEQAGGDILLYDVTTHFSTNWANGDSFKINAASGTANTVEDVGAEVIITYTYDALNTTTGLKTVWWWVGQQNASSTANFTQATSDSTGDLFDTYLPETGTKTLRSAGVIGNFLNASITTTAKFADVKIDSAQAGTSEQASSFLLTAEANSLVVIHNDTAAANPQMTNASQTGVDFTLCPPSSTSGCSASSPISSNRSAIAYSTYESTVPAAPENLGYLALMVPFLPFVMNWVGKKRKALYV